MTDNPLISILTPSYNHEKYVGFFINSLIAQTYKNWELIIVDDSSTDNNVAEIRKFSDSRIHLFIQEFNQGPGVALNKAFAESHGEIIVDMASDDMLYPDYFEFIIKTFKEKTDIGLIYSSLDIIDKNNKVYSTNLLPKEKSRTYFLKELFYKGNVLFSPGFAIRREIYSTIIPMDVSMVQHQDYQWHVLFLGQTECCITDKPYVKYRYIPYNKTSLSSFNLGEFNRMRLEIDTLMNSFLKIKDIKLIKEITRSDLCDKLNSDCYEFIWATEAIKCNTYEKRQWGYKTLARIYNDDNYREMLYKELGFKFSDFLAFSTNYEYYNDNTFFKKKIRSKFAKIYKTLFYNIFIHKKKY